MADGSKTAESSSERSICIFWINHKKACAYAGLIWGNGVLEEAFASRDQVYTFERAFEILLLSSLFYYFYH